MWVYSQECISLFSYMAKASDEIDRQVYEYRWLNAYLYSRGKQGESQWGHRPKVYKYRGSMPICISSSTQGESPWGHRPLGLWVHDSMPICISSSTQGESQWGHRPSGLWVHGSMPLVSLWKKWKICRIIKKP